MTVQQKQDTDPKLRVLTEIGYSFVRAHPSYIDPMFVDGKCDYASAYLAQMNPELKRVYLIGSKIPFPQAITHYHAYPDIPDPHLYHSVLEYGDHIFDPTYHQFSPVTTFPHIVEKEGYLKDWIHVVYTEEERDALL